MSQLVISGISSMGTASRVATNYQSGAADWAFTGPLSPGVSTFTLNISSIPKGATINSISGSITSATAGTYEYYIQAYDTTRQPNYTQLLSRLLTVLQNFTDNDRPDIISLKAVNTTRSPSLPTTAGGYLEKRTCYTYPTVTFSDLTIDYTYGSGGSISADSVTAGSTITLTIDPEDPSFTHGTEWYLEGHASDTRGTTYHSTLTTGSNLTRSYTIPSDWLNDFGPTDASKQGYCSIITYEDGVAINADNPIIVSFTITASSSDFTPSITFTSINSVDNSDTLYTSSYYSYYTKPKFNFSVTLKYGATGNYYILADGALLTSGTISASSSAQSFSVVSPNYFPSYGSRTYTIQIVDSRNNSSSASKTISIIEMKKPTITLNVRRCTPMGVADISGNYMLVSYVGTKDTTHLTNSTTTIEFYYKLNTDSSYTKINNTNLTSLSQTNTVLAISGTSTTAYSSPANSYSYKIVLTDRQYSAEATFELSKAKPAMHMKQDNNEIAGIAMGTFSSAEMPITESPTTGSDGNSQNHPKFECGYPPYLNIKYPHKIASNDELYGIRVVDTDDGGLQGYITIVL